MIDHNGDEVTETTSPFWIKDQAIHFQSSNVEDEGIYKWNSIGLTIAVTYEGTEIEFPTEEVEIIA